MRSIAFQTVFTFGELYDEADKSRGLIVVVPQQARHELASMPLALFLLHLDFDVLVVAYPRSGTSHIPTEEDLFNDMLTFWKLFCRQERPERLAFVGFGEGGGLCLKVARRRRSDTPQPQLSIALNGVNFPRHTTYPGRVLFVGNDGDPSSQEGQRQYARLSELAHNQNTAYINATHLYGGNDFVCPHHRVWGDLLLREFDTAFKP